MKYTNEDNDERVYPTLGVVLEAGKSFDDSSAKIEIPQKINLSAPSDITVEEVK